MQHGANEGDSREAYLACSVQDLEHNRDVLVFKHLLVAILDGRIVL